MNRRPLPADAAIDLAAVDEAARRIAPWVATTPVLHSPAIDDRLGLEVRFKAEHLQVTGSFKFRGASNAVASLSSDERSRGVVAWSSGNHAQAVGRAAELQGTSAVIVMPHDAPPVKVEATAATGARLVRYDRYTEDREAIGRRIAADEQRVIIPPYDRAEVMAGQGTVARELFGEVEGLDAFYVCLGGGGLLSGCSTVTAAVSPQTRVFGVEPTTGDDHRRSRAAGHRVTIEVPQTIADGQQTVSPGELTWPINDALVSDFLAVDDDSIVAAMRLLEGELGIRIEPSGASAFAALVAGHRPPAGATRVAVTLSGGNVGADRFDELTGG